MTYPSLKNLAVKHYKLWACNVITSLAQIFNSWICHLSKFCNISARYDEQVSWCREKLDELEKKGVYDKANSVLHIEDRNNLTDDEKSAIMIILTGNPDIYSYAAENQYHAKKYGDLLGIFNSHCIISDAGVGESALGEGYEESFKDETGKYYKEQVESHKSVLYEQVRINE